jgi:hypothetical protein
VDKCDRCGKDLRDKPALKSSNERLIEDISDPVEETEVIKIIQEKKYCDDCKVVITAKSERALPGADIGLNASVLICYPLGRAVFALSEDKRLSQSFFWIRALHSRFVKPCHSRVRTHERGL